MFEHAEPVDLINDLVGATPNPSELETSRHSAAHVMAKARGGVAPGLA